MSRPQTLATVDDDDDASLSWTWATMRMADDWLANPMVRADRVAWNADDTAAVAVALSHSRQRYCRRCQCCWRSLRLSASIDGALDWNACRTGDVAGIADCTSCDAGDVADDDVVDVGDAVVRPYR